MQQVNENYVNVSKKANAYNITALREIMSRNAFWDSSAIFFLLYLVIWNQVGMSKGTLPQSAVYMQMRGATPMGVIFRREITHIMLFFK